MLLEHIGQKNPPNNLKDAVFSVISDGAKPGDQGSNLSTTEFTAEVAHRGKSRPSN